MIRKILTTILSFLCVFYLAAASPTDSNLIGHVVDGENGDHLAYCTIQIKGCQIGCLTDGSGHYAIRDLKPV